jgi:ABC-type nitrate/sulfonate/bicarbonate transport system permease component
MEFLRAVPVIAVVPIAIVLLGDANAMRVAVIAFGVFFPVLVATVDGVRAVPLEIRDTAALFRLGEIERRVRVYLPSALPTIFAGLRAALSISSSSTSSSLPWTRSRAPSSRTSFSQCTPRWRPGVSRSST